MKRLMKVIASHGKHYYQLLSEHWQGTDWSETEVQIVLDHRIGHMLDQLPSAVKEDHEQIIGKRKVPNHDKILSVYEAEIRILVRGKAGAEMEFGNTLYLAE